MQWNRKNSGFGLRSSSLATYLLYEICLLSLFSEPLLSSVMTIVSNRKFIHAGPIRQFSRSTNVGKVVYKWKNAIQNSMTARYKTAEKSVVKIHSEILWKNGSDQSSMSVGELEAQVRCVHSVLRMAFQAPVLYTL